MKCPLRGLYTEKTSMGDQPDQRPCLEQECAWWGEKYGRCAILGYLEASERLARTLRKIDTKIGLGGG